VSTKRGEQFPEKAEDAHGRKFEGGIGWGGRVRKLTGASQNPFETAYASNESNFPGG
jgi:hypothetical protein